MSPIKHTVIHVVIFSFVYFITYLTLEMKSEKQYAILNDLEKAVYADTL